MRLWRAKCKRAAPWRSRPHYNYHHIFNRYTAPEEQIPKAGDATPSTTALEEEMTSLGFELAQPRENVPFLIREHARKFQWGVSESSVWRKKKQQQ